jgi:methionyl-tRNA formyltransferase
VRIVFAGTPQVALPSLEALLDSDHEVLAVITRPPARSGRGRQLVDSEVATAIVVIGIKQEGIRDVHPQFSQVVEGIL